MIDVTEARPAVAVTHGLTAVDTAAETSQIKSAQRVKKGTCATCSNSTYFKRALFLPASSAVLLRIWRLAPPFSLPRLLGPES